MNLLAGDCIEQMRELDDCSIDAIVTDPPYGLGFMGHEWDQPGDFSAVRANGRPRPFAAGGDRRELQRAMERSQRRGTHHTGTGFDTRPRDNGAFEAGRYDFSPSANQRFQAWCEAWATEALRVLKPGGHALVFGGTRTYHRLTCGLEDAGFEIRDCIAWMFGSGFPKSRNLDGDWQGWGTALKPAHEPVVVARKPLVGTVAANVLAHGTGAINVDGCRVESRGEADERETKEKNRHTDFGSGPISNEVYGEFNRPRDNYDAEGRWPANVVLDEEAAESLDAQVPRTARGHFPAATKPSAFQGIGFAERPAEHGPERNTDIGGASRFFYCAKTSRAERNAGLEGFATTVGARTPMAGRGQGGLKCRSCGRWKVSGNPCACPKPDFEPSTFERPATANNHPTVKPIDLMRWLVRLVTPPGGTVLDPFLGSGTTGIAAELEGFQFVGIEREPDYLAIAEARIAFWREHGEDGLRIVAEGDAANRRREEVAAAGQLDLLGEIA